MNLDSKRWLVLIASCLINLCVGSIYAWSVFAKPLVALLGVSGAAAAMAFTIANSISPIPMVLGGRLQDKFGPKWVIFVGGVLFGIGWIGSGYTSSLTALYVFYGIFAGLGVGTVYSCTIANTVKFFPDKRGLVAGIVTAAYGLSAVLVGPIANSLIASSGVLNTFKVLGIVFLVVIVGCSFFVMTAPAGYKPAGWNPPAPAAGSAVSGVDKNWPQMLLDPKFYILMLMLMAGAFSGLMIVSQASPIAQEVIKVTPATAALVVSILALANMAGRIFWGWVSDIAGRYNSLTVMYIILAISMFVLSTVNTFTPFMLVVMAVGFCFGGLMGIFPALTADTFGPKNNGVNYGIMFCGFALAAYFGPITAAKIKIASGGYTQAFIIAATISIIGILLTQLVRYKNKKAQEARAIAG
ncbi:MAG: OFA family MFS transporter [Desulfotomaculaceae bacterium]|nr:OFA family MFS transporter [Desulfotomaculaceae bacterium]